MEPRRLTAKKATIADIVSGQFVRKSGFESSYVLTKNSRKISRVRILGLVVDKFVSEDGNYATITLDDGSETMRAKAFINIKIFDPVVKGQLVDLFGKLREYEGEIYIMPEIIRQVEPNFETLRKLELKKISKEQEEKIKKLKELQKEATDLAELKILTKEFMSDEDVEAILEGQSATEEGSLETSEAKNKILDLIEKLDAGQGADYQQILAQSALKENTVDITIQDLLESGVCFEPRPGKIKKL